MPTYNRAELLRRAILSFCAQTETGFRLRVFDNASADGTREVVEALASRDARIEYFRHERNIGAIANFRYAMEQVDTEYFAFASDDDVSSSKVPRGFARWVHSLSECGAIRDRHARNDTRGRLVVSASGCVADRWLFRGGNFTFAHARRYASELEYDSVAARGHRRRRLLRRLAWVWSWTSPIHYGSRRDTRLSCRASRPEFLSGIGFLQASMLEQILPLIMRTPSSILLVAGILCHHWPR